METRLEILRPEPSRPALALVVAALAAALPGPSARGAPALLPEPLPADEYTETFTFVADLDDGTYVQLQLAVTNLGPGSGTGLCRALVKRPGAPAWTRHARVPRSGWRHEADAAGEALTIGPCSARSGAGTQVRVQLADRAVELAFPERAEERATVAAFQEGDRRYRAVVLHAFTPVSVRLDGFGPAGALPGAGYADHSRSDLPARALARRWVRFRALRPPRELLVLARERGAGGWDPALIWRRGEAPRPLGGVGLRRTAGAEAGWEASLLDGGSVATITSGARLFRHSPLEELGVIGRLAGTLFTVPITYTYRATLQAGGPSDGILEISVLGEE